jgi:WD40 repeat protein
MGDSVTTVDEQGQVAQWQGDNFQQKQTLIELGTNALSTDDLEGRICLSPEGRLLAAGSTNGIVRVWDLQKLTPLAELNVQWVMQPYRLRFMPDGHRLAIFHDDDQTLHLWDLTTRQQTHSWNTHAFGGFGGDAVSPDQRWYVLWGWKGEPSLIETATGRDLNPNWERLEPYAASFSPDGKTLAAASSDGFVRLWDTATWREVTTLRGFLLACHSVAFSPDGNRLAAGSNGKEAVKLWDIHSHRQLLTLEGQGSEFGPTAFSPDGKVLGSSNHEGYLYLWRAPSWQEIATEEAKEKAETRQP